VISILLPDLRGGGAERVNLDLAHEFVRAGHEVEFVLMQARGELLEEARTSFSVVDLATPRARGLPLALARYLRQRRPDAILAAMWPLTGIAGVAMTMSGHRARLVASEHVDFRFTPSLKPFERFILKHFGRLLYAPCHLVVGVSSGVCESLSVVAGLPKEKLCVIHNPVRQIVADEMTAEDQNFLSGWLQSSSRIIAIGSLKRQKGFDVLLHALAEVNKRKDVKLLILGEGSLRKDLLDLAAELRIQDDLWLPGFRSNPVTYLKHAKCFVLSSNWEGFGNVIVEALNTGVPVVSTDCPSGPSEILHNGEYGILISPGNSKELAEAIISCLNSKHDTEHLKKRASDFNPELKAKIYLDLLLGNKSA
jgi:glycosyltransferase involved in cell wall biosynthesis